VLHRSTPLPCHWCREQGDIHSNEFRKLSNRVRGFHVRARLDFVFTRDAESPFVHRYCACGAGGPSEERASGGLPLRVFFRRCKKPAE